LLQRVIENLVTNGLRYGKDEGTVRIAVHEKDGQALLSVSDDGIGIATKDQAHLFERFYRADDSRAGTGAGLGLALCDEIARAHGGGIAVESELGIGSAFTVWIPQR
jgi:two-component system OmpR family sensor kinase